MVAYLATGGDHRGGGCFGSESGGHGSVLSEGAFLHPHAKG